MGLEQNCLISSHKLSLHMEKLTSEKYGRAYFESLVEDSVCINFKMCLKIQLFLLIHSL